MPEGEAIFQGWVPLHSHSEVVKFQELLRSSTMSEDDETRLIGGRSRQKQSEEHAATRLRETENLTSGENLKDGNQSEVETKPTHRKGDGAIDGPTPETEEPAMPMPPSDFVRGWLVVIGGPGVGKSLEIGTGQNQIGRHPSNRISLPFGDQNISRECHAILSYDPKKRKFHLTNNQTGQNLTYLNDDAVYAPTEMKAGDVIGIGATKLKFYPLCGEAFDWSDILGQEAEQGAVAQIIPGVPLPSFGDDDDRTILNRS